MLTTWLLECPSCGSHNVHVIAASLNCLVLCCRDEPSEQGDPRGHIFIGPQIITK